MCPEIPAEGPVDLQAFHATQARRYIGAFGLSATMALFSNLVLGGVYNIAEWSMQNLAVVPLLAATVVAVIWRRPWIDIAVPIVLGAVWIFYLVDLQGALH